MLKNLSVLLLLCISPLSSLSAVIYEVSIDENETKLSNCELRTQHPLRSDLHWGFVPDRQLYRTKPGDEELQYNSAEEVKKFCETFLKPVAKISHRARPTEPEKDALRHVFVLAISFLDGKNGVPEDRNFGAGLMEFYLTQYYVVHPLYFLQERKVQKCITKLASDTSCLSSSFVDKVRAIHEENGVITLLLSHSSEIDKSALSYSKKTHHLFHDKLEAIKPTGKRGSFNLL